mmetsp:Transcript_13833/g.43806  ORF Transcript_13833/g.43806 Transcript_13833/m.43806 type:complete len:203 (+) Transcript_13833:1344-1952(+)
MESAFFARKTYPRWRKVSMARKSLRSTRMRPSLSYVVPKKRARRRTTRVPKGVSRPTGTRRCAWPRMMGGRKMRRVIPTLKSTMTSTATRRRITITGESMMMVHWSEKSQSVSHSGCTSSMLRLRALRLSKKSRSSSGQSRGILPNSAEICPKPTEMPMLVKEPIMSATLKAMGAKSAAQMPTINPICPLSLGQSLHSPKMR